MFQTTRHAAVVLLRLSISRAFLLAAILSMFAQSAFAQPLSCGDPTDWQPDDSALQACLDWATANNGTISLTIAFPGYIVDGTDLNTTDQNPNDHLKGLYIKANTTLTAAGGSENARARILAGRHLFARILRTEEHIPTPNVVIRYIEFNGMVDQVCGETDATDPNPSLSDCQNYLPQESGDLTNLAWRVRKGTVPDVIDDCSDDGADGHPGNLLLQGPNYIAGGTPLIFAYNHSVEALCGSGLGLFGHFNVDNNYIARNGRDVYTEHDNGETPWSDGITALWCHNGFITNNLLVDNTDIGIAIFGSNTCTVAGNIIVNTGKYGFAGLNPGNSPSEPPATPGEHTNSEFRDNTIYTLVPDKLAIGLLLGTHPWKTEPQWTAHNVGNVYGNVVYNTVTNMVIDGIEGGNVYANNVGGATSGIDGMGDCDPGGLPYVVNTDDVGSAVYQTGWEYLVYHPDGCVSGKLFSNWREAPKTKTAEITVTNSFDTLKFYGKAGDRARLEAAGGTFTWGRIDIRNPDGSFLAGTWVGMKALIEVRLPVTGTYKVIVDPDGSNVGEITLTLSLLSPDPVTTTSHKVATSWEVPTGSGSATIIQTGATAAARKWIHPDMPSTGLRLGVKASAGTVDSFTNGPSFIGNNPNQPKQGGIFLEFEVERYPTIADAEFLGTETSAGGPNAIRAYITTSGQLVVKHDGGRTTPQVLWTSSALGLNTPHSLQLRFEHNSESVHPSPNPDWENMTSWAQVIFDGATVVTYGAIPGGVWQSGETTPKGLDVASGTTSLVFTSLKSPAATNGLLMNVWKAALLGAQSHGDPMETYETNWRSTLLQAADAGTYSAWTGGRPDWRARSIIAGDGTFPLSVSSSVLGEKISYRMESMASRGISGQIGSVLVGVRMQAASAATKAFIRRNGVDTTLTDFTLASNDTRWYRVATSGWSTTDVVEVGVTNGVNATNSLFSVALIVEHDSPEPEPFTDRTTQVIKRPYTGNGTAQTIDFGNNLVPTAVLVMALNASTAVEPMWWWESRQGAAGMSSSLTNFSRIWPQRGKMHVVDGASRSFNVSGVDYVAIALFDPTGRYVVPFAVSKPLAEDNYTHKLRDPQSGALLSNFTPDFIFGGAAFGNSADSTKASLYRGPGHTGDLTAKLGVAQASDADRIQALGAGTVQFGTLIGHGSGDHAFWAGRVSDGVSSTRLMAVTSYVGDGTSSRDIALSLSGSTPEFALVVPTTAVAKVYRVNGDTTGRRTDTGNAVSNSITALGTDKITVGSALNASNVTYDVWVITTGTINP
ncbi:MAG: right-handed parallel beta-helix repeat-containing protein [Cyanobacteria bacterium]|nr:right-handed parallel beta-helix repeat-containing protein [Cyanobacteriota bacterium]